MKWLPAEAGSAVGVLRANAAVYGGVQRWLIVRWSQAMGVGFHLAAVLTFVGLVAFTDLAFSWSTTIDVSPEHFHTGVMAVSVPWGWAWPEAVPSQGLVEQTRYFRGQAFEPQGRQGWWRFLLMLMLVYGLLPRVVAWGWAQWRLRRASGWALRQTPGVTALLGRLHNAAVKTSHGGDDAAVAGSGADETTGQEGAAGHVVSEHDGSAGGGADDEPVVWTLGWGGLEGEARVGGRQSLEEDAEAIGRAAEAVKDRAGAVRLRVRGWEPPVLDVVDFLGDLRRALGPGRTVVVEAQISEGQGMGVSGVGVWRDRLRQLGDPWLTVVSSEVGVVSDDEMTSPVSRGSDSSATS